MINESITSYGEFKWLIQKEIDKFDVVSIEWNYIEENSSDGYILQVDLQHPNKLCKIHDGYPLAKEKLKINHSMWDLEFTS